MREFVFNLEVLLRYRSHLEEKERERLADLHNRLRAEYGTLQRLRDRHAAARRDLERQTLREYDAREVGWYCAFLRRLDQELDMSARRIRALQRELEAQVALWIEKTKDRRVLESLREKKQKEHQVAATRLEQKAVDEIVVTRYAGKG